MNILSTLSSVKVEGAGVSIQGTQYTWTQSLRYFVIGAIWAVGLAMPPVVWTVYHNWDTYSDPQDWPLVWGIFITAAGPAFWAYWKAKKNLLQLPPGLIIPPEFRPDKVTTIEERGPHTTETITQGTGTGDGVVKEIRSEHETKVTTIAEQTTHLDDAKQDGK